MRQSTLILITNTSHLLYNHILLFFSLLSALEDSPHESTSLLPPDEGVVIGVDVVTSKEVGNVVLSTMEDDLLIEKYAIF